MSDHPEPLDDERAEAFEAERELFLMSSTSRTMIRCLIMTTKLHPPRKLPCT
jgi:hypothetical protein